MNSNEKLKSFFVTHLTDGPSLKGQVNSAYDIRYPRVINNNFQKHKRVSEKLCMISFPM